MRGVAPLTVLALLLLAAPTAVAAHGDVSDLDERLLEDVLRENGFELLLLPPSVAQELRAPVDVSLPGPNDPLALDLGLLTARPDVVGLTGDLQPALWTPPAPNTATRTGTAAVPPVAAVTEAVAPATAHNVQGDDPSAQDAGEATDDDGPSTQARSAETPAATDLQAAWDSLDTKEKAAITAGALALLLLGPLTMYSRIARSETLENDTRRRIYELIEATPGLCIKEVAEQVDVSYSTASYHLDRLVKTDYLVSSDEGNKVLYYKNGGTFSPAERELVPVLKTPECMAVFEHILEHPWCYRAEVAQALGVSHTTINWHLKRLLEADLVEEHREGRNCHLHIPDEALDRVCAVMDKLEATGGLDEVVMAEPEAEPVPA